MAAVPNDDKQSPDPIIQLGPGAVERAVQNAIEICWLILPPQKKSVDCLEYELKRILERTLQNIREDEQAFRRDLAD